MQRTEFMFFEPVHLPTDVWINFFNLRRSTFPELKSGKFCDSIKLDRAEITWKLLPNVYDKDENLPGNLKKACKLPFKLIQPKNNKQNVSLVLSIYLMPKLQDTIFQTVVMIQDISNLLTYEGPLAIVKVASKSKIPIFDLVMQPLKVIANPASGNISRLVRKMANFTRSLFSKIYFRWTYMIGAMHYLCHRRLS